MPTSIMRATDSPNVGAVRTYLDLSTAHVSFEVMDAIDTIPGVVADVTDYGAWLWVPSQVEDWIEEIDEQIPQCVIDIWRYARSLECDHVHLDCDTNTTQDLPTYAW